MNHLLYLFHNFQLILILGLIVRIIFLIYGAWQDRNFDVPFTDIDYRVFTDAAELMVEGKSPFSRHTYRYTPILAWMLQPNILFFPEFGKILFVIFDLICGWFIFIILKQKVSPKKASLYSSFWVLNPIVFTVSVRGSCDCIISAILLFIVYSLRQGNWIIPAFLYGFVVHFRLFPIFYAFTFYFFLSSNGSLFSFRQIMFGIISASTFFGFTFLCYYIYGYECLFESLLYHLGRKDHRHNFSIYYLSNYLTMETSEYDLSQFSFFPMLLLIAVATWKLHHRLELCLLIQTLIFVTFNKVCTAQYFLWYMTFIPIAAPEINMSTYTTIALILFWVVTEVHWLFWAYRLEFLGESVFRQLWMACIFFFLAQSWVILKILDSMTAVNTSSQKKKGD